MGEESPGVCWGRRGTVVLLEDEQFGGLTFMTLKSAPNLVDKAKHLTALSSLPPAKQVVKSG